MAIGLIIVGLIGATGVVLNVLVLRRKLPAQLPNVSGALADSLVQGSIEELHRISKKNAGRLHIHDVETVIRARRRALGG